MRREVARSNKVGVGKRKRKKPDINRRSSILRNWDRKLDTDTRRRTKAIRRRKFKLLRPAHCSSIVRLSHGAESPNITGKVATHMTGMETPSMNLTKQSEATQTYRVLSELPLECPAEQYRILKWPEYRRY
jgi:hypothetical protein